jgi:putative ABC transport system substrate-binding protein
MGLEIQVLNATSGKEIDTAFASAARRTPDALLVGTEPPFTSRRVQLVELATYYKIPAIYALREIAEIGGLMSYGASLREAYRQVGFGLGKSARAQLAQRFRRSFGNTLNREQDWHSRIAFSDV